ncbi:NACHT domain- and WD repeat-containing protein 1 isoform X1 [Dermacentor silvarum]|uniref:NACHT domain- and WD repeat-containing protein 1 isoform X1 n=1 Tax=Dermacentor silvarum TaxID=543639 RepID=UPI001896DC06|nr:NACHT domain- and WD repeat-containing protein 1 isoform X1 [Dermacentor silvarum]XP_049527905.1 NACHT domain- and WD repeat-containing protein 1 isoform X1 [Dermacentor silvarum]
MGSSCSSAQKKDKDRSKKKKKGSCSPEGRRRSSVRSTDSLPYGKESTPPPSRSDPSVAATAGITVPPLAPVDTSLTEVQQNSGSLASPAPQVTSPAPGSDTFSDDGLPCLQSFPDDVQALLLGRLGAVPASLLAAGSRLISLYICCGLADMEAERTHLEQHVYPSVRAYAADKGYDLNVVDLHWGIQVEAMDRDTFAQLCRLTISRLRTQGHFLALVLLNEKLENQLPHILPASLPSDVLMCVIDAVESPEQRQLLLDWYMEDLNCVPKCYRLRAIREHIPDIVSVNPSARTAAFELWQKQASQMVEALRSTLSTEQRGKYLVSVVEEELEAAVLTESQKPLCCLWMERRFTHRGPQRSNSVVGTLVEPAEGTGPIDLSDSKRYNLVRAQLEDRLPESQKLVLRVKWSKEGPNAEENIEYFDELSTTLSRDLKAMVDTVGEEDASDETTRPCRGIEQQLYVELVQQAQTCLSLSETLIGRTEKLVQLEKYLRSKLHHPIVLHGARGSGKSTLLAKVAQMCETWVPDAPVIVRFVGTSPDSDTQQQLLRSICEQCCALYGMHTIFASKSIAEQREVLGVLLDKVSSHRPLIILLDGLDQVTKHSAYTFDWLPSELPPYVKVVLTVRDGSKELEDLKAKLKNQEQCFIDLGPCGVEHCKNIFHKSLERRSRTVSAKQLESVSASLQQSPSPLFATLLASAVSHWHGTDEPSIFHSEAEVVSFLHDQLKKEVHPKVTSLVLGLLSASRHGLSDKEIIDVVSSNESLLAEMHLVHRKRLLTRCPFAVWALVRVGLDNFLRVRVVEGYVLNTWCSDSFRTLCTEHCPSLEATHVCTLALFDYFQSVSSMDVSSVTSATEADKGSQCVLPHVPKNAVFSYRRKHNELPFYCLHLNCLARENLASVDTLLSRLQVANGPAGDNAPVKCSDSSDSSEALGQIVRSQFLLNPEWLQIKVCCCDPYFLLEELDMFLKLNPADTECAMLRELVQLSSYALRYDGRQFAAHVTARFRKIIASEASDLKFPHLKNLYEMARRFPSLVPVSDYLREPSKEPASTVSHEEEKGRTLGQLYTIKGDASHMVSLNRSDLLVWDVFGESIVRRLTGLSEPRDLKMVDRFRALVLCNRELKVYSLDEGRLLVKLKGVMNQKMAYFGLHSQDYVVALSRNRMYVNMLNLSSGDLETTFKVGEDRFLNSLLVSGNGKICVCGDETQKPFPLLVWDLANRKLLYDLRIPHHEFITRLSAISGDGHYVVCVCRELSDSAPNFIIVYDLQSGTLFKKWKPERNSCSIAISSQGGCVVNGLDNCFVLVWDLATGARRYTLKGHNAPVDQIRLDESGFKSLTYNSDGIDRSVRVWDVMKGECLAVFTPDLAVTCCELTLDGKAVVMGLEGHDRVFCHLLHEGEGDQSPSQSRPASNAYGNVSNCGKVFDVSQQG